RLAPPVLELFDPFVDQGRGRSRPRRVGFLHVSLLLRVEVFGTLGRQPLSAGASQVGGFLATEGLGRPLPAGSSGSNGGEAAPISVGRGAQDPAEVEPERLCGAETDGFGDFVDARARALELALCGENALVGQPAVGRGAKLCLKTAIERAW